MEIHSPDVYGPIALAGSAGTAGQQLTSAGPGAQAVWSASGGIVVTDTATVNLTLAGNSLSADAIISPDAGNELVAHANGLYSPIPLVNKFTFTSASAVSHTITHNLNNQFPDVTIYETATNTQIEPATVVGTSANVLTVTFFSARAIAGTVIG